MWKSARTFARAAFGREAGQQRLWRRTKRNVLASTFGGGMIFAVAAVRWGQGQYTEELNKLDDEATGEEALSHCGVWREDLKTYTMDDVKRHNNAETGGIWVVFRYGVYDVTDFVAQHPGQEKILLAAGGPIEPFWAMYQQHATGFVAKILEGLRIGNIDREVPTPGDKDPNDPYANDPYRHPALIVRSAKPFNAEVPASLLAEQRITPTELFYVRNHLPVPEIDPATYTLEITGENLPKGSIRLSIDDLKKFPKHEVEVTIQCAGNRRNEMHNYKAVKGGAWETGAISNAKWAGARLRDVLMSVGVDGKGCVDDKCMTHAQFEGLDRDFEKNYGSSIPIDKAIAEDGDVILAWEMNGEPIPRDHGYPIRAVVPGIVGARNVKWLGKIHLSESESPSHWQQNDYKGFCPSVDWHNVDFKTAPAIQELPVNSAITEPAEGAIIPADAKAVSMKGFAWSGGGRGIVRVDVSADGGQTWIPATLDTPDQPRNRVWAWTLWNAKVEIPSQLQEDGSKKLQLVVKAIDSQYNNQPERVDAIWNLRGVLTNNWHKVNVTQQAAPIPAHVAAAQAAASAPIA